MPDFPVVPPHEAGAQIRVLATQIYEVLSKTPHQTPQTFHPTLNVETCWERCRHTQQELERAIEFRRLREMRPALAAYKEAVRRYRNAVYQAAGEQLTLKKVSYPLTSTGSPVAEAIEQLRKLANNLPTQPDMPSADSRDTALRAIIAVLRTHEVPGSADLTHQAKEDQSAKAHETVGDKPGPEDKPADKLDLAAIFESAKPAV